jgi:hypothetical protein
MRAGGARVPARYAKMPWLEPWHVDVFDELLSFLKYVPKGVNGEFSSEIFRNNDVRHRCPL